TVEAGHAACRWAGSVDCAGAHPHAPSEPRGTSPGAQHAAMRPLCEHQAIVPAEQDRSFGCSGSSRCVSAHANTGPAAASCTVVAAEGAADESVEAAGADDRVAMRKTRSDVAPASATTAPTSHPRDRLAGPETAAAPAGDAPRLASLDTVGANAAA